MGMNYYIVENHCSHCNRGDKRHVGKSSAGWCFSLHVYPDEGINTIEDWKAILRSAWRIEDEDGDEIEADVLIARITERSWNGGKRQDHPHGYQDWQQFNDLNHCHEGPNGLSRHNVDGRHCIGNGEGTWDYMIGEFS